MLTPTFRLRSTTFLSLFQSVSRSAFLSSFRSRRARVELQPSRFAGSADSVPTARETGELRRGLLKKNCFAVFNRKMVLHLLKRAWRAVVDFFDALKSLDLCNLAFVAPEAHTVRRTRSGRHWKRID